MPDATVAESNPDPDRVNPTSGKFQSDESELTQCAVSHHSAHWASQSTKTSNARRESSIARSSACRESNPSVTTVNVSACSVTTVSVS